MVIIGLPEARFERGAKPGRILSTSGSFGPGQCSGSLMRSLETKYSLLQVVSHSANGMMNWTARHFEQPIHLNGWPLNSIFPELPFSHPSTPLDSRCPLFNNGSGHGCGRPSS